MSKAASSILAPIYAALTDALFPPGAFGLPEWMGLPGSDWPVFRLAVEMAQAEGSEDWFEAVTRLAQVPGASPQALQSAYDVLFIGTGKAPYLAV